MDPIQRTQDRIGQTDEKPNSPVIPLIPNGSKKSVTPSPIPGLPEGKDLTLVHGTTIPITISEITPGLGIAVGKDRKVLLDIGPGVNVLFLDGKLRVRANAISFLGWPFLIVLGTACAAVLMAIYFKISNSQAPAPPQPENKTVTAPRATPIVTPAINAANNLAKPEKTELKVDGLLPKDDHPEGKLGRFPIYESAKNLYPLIGEKDEATSMYKEAVQLKNIGISFDDETRKDYLKQSIIRLGALLTKSALPEAYQRLAAKQLWIIQYCYLKQLPQAKETELLIKKLNARAPKDFRVVTMCPKDDE